MRPKIHEILNCADSALVLCPSVVSVKAKFHYASWFGDGSEPASVMEFGFYWTTRGYANSRTGHLADATGDSPCLVFVLLAASARPRVVQSASWRIRELSSYPRFHCDVASTRVTLELIVGILRERRVNFHLKLTNRFIGVASCAALEHMPAFTSNNLFLFQLTL